MTHCGYTTSEILNNKLDPNCMGQFLIGGAATKRNQVFSWFIDGTILIVTTGRDGKTVVQVEPCFRPVPSTISPTVNLYHPALLRKSRPFTLPSRPVDEISRYRPVPSTNPTPTVPSRRQNLPIPSRPAVNTATPICTTVVQIKRARLENASRTTHPETHL